MESVQCPLDGCRYRSASHDSFKRHYTRHQAMIDGAMADGDLIREIAGTDSATQFNPDQKEELAKLPEDIAQAADDTLSDLQRDGVARLGREYFLKQRGMVDPESNPQPDLRTLAGQLAFLDYHAPDPRQQAAHQFVNSIVQDCWTSLSIHIPDGPGKTRLLHKMQALRMEANCVIANHGA